MHGYELWSHTLTHTLPQQPTNQVGGRPAMPVGDACTGRAGFMEPRRRSTRDAPRPAYRPPLIKLVRAARTFFLRRIDEIEGWRETEGFVCSFRIASYLFPVKEIKVPARTSSRASGHARADSRPVNRDRSSARAHVLRPSDGGWWWRLKSNVHRFVSHRSSSAESS
jgi:hypothetical protein